MKDSVRANLIKSKKVRNALLALTILTSSSALASFSASAQNYPLPPVADPHKPPLVAVLDYAKIISVPDDTGSIILGNSGIIDVTMSGKNRAILTAKGYGYTNLVIISKDGRILSEDLIRVARTDYKKVFLRKGTSQFTYVCDPTCQPTIELGDDRTHISNTGGSISLRASLARGS